MNSEAFCRLPLTDQEARTEFLLDLMVRALVRGSDVKRVLREALNDASIGGYYVGKREAEDAQRRDVRRKRLVAKRGSKSGR